MKVKNSELETVAGGREDAPANYESPRCQWCGEPASYVTFEIVTAIGTIKEEKHIFCQKCIDRKIEEIEHSGAKVQSISAVL